MNDFLPMEFLLEMNEKENKQQQQNSTFFDA